MVIYLFETHYAEVTMAQRFFLKERLRQAKHDSQVRLNCFPRSLFCGYLQNSGISVNGIFFNDDKGAPWYLPQQD